MHRKEHIHIISVGEHIGNAYPAAIRDLQTVTRTFLFADTDLYTNSAGDGEKTKSYKTAARDAVNTVRSISASLGIPASLVYIDPPADRSVVKAVETIAHDFPGARYTFDLTGGTKDLSMALFAVSLWLDGDAGYAFTGRKGTEPVARLTVPKGNTRSVLANPNHMRILTILATTPGAQEPLPRVLPRTYIFTQTESFYIPVRKKGVHTAPNTTGKADARTGKKAVIPQLSQGTLSSLLDTLESWDLIRTVPGTGDSRKEKYYQITAAGELALGLFGSRPGSRT
jgi:hypothetical protein